MRRIALLLLFLFVGRCALAQTYSAYQNCQLQNAQGQAISGANVYFLTQPNSCTKSNGITTCANLSPLANVYATTTGTSVTQPVQTNGFGTCSAYLTPALYTVCYVSPYTGQICYPDQVVTLPNGGTGQVNTVTASLPLASTGGNSPNITVSQSTGSGAIVEANSPTLITPNIGAATGTSLITSSEVLSSGLCPVLDNTDGMRICYDQLNSRAYLIAGVSDYIYFGLGPTTAAGIPTTILGNFDPYGDFTATGDGTFGAINTTLPSAQQGSVTNNGVNLGYSDTGVTDSRVYIINGYIQEIIQNNSTGTSASACWITGNSATTASSFYGEFCENGTGFTGTGSLSGAGNVTLDSQGEDLVVGTFTANPLHFVYSNSATDSILINGNGVSLPSTLGTSPSTSPVCPNGTGGALTTSGCSGGGGSGTVNNSTQYSVPYYSAAGSANTISGSSITGISYYSASAAPVVANVNNLATPSNCVSASGSGTLYTCTTSPTTTILNNTTINFVPDVTSGINPTLAVNGASAAPIYQQQGTSQVTASDLIANYPVQLTWNSSTGHWLAQGQLAATSAGKINGVAVPASAKVIGSNASSQLIDNSAATLSNNTTGNALTATTAANLSGTPTLPNGTLATTQTAGDATAKLATDSFVTTAVANGCYGYNGCPTQINPAPSTSSPTLTATLSSGATSATISNCALLSSQGVGFILDATSLIEWISWTGCSSGTLSGLVRGLYGSSALTWTPGVFYVVQATNVIANSYSSAPSYYATQGGYIHFGGYDAPGLFTNGSTLNGAAATYDVGITATGNSANQPFMGNLGFARGNVIAPFLSWATNTYNNNAQCIGQKGATSWAGGNGVHVCWTGSAASSFGGNNLLAFFAGPYTNGQTSATPIGSIDTSGNMLMNSYGIGSNVVIPSTVTGYNGNATGVKVPLSVAFAGSAGAAVCDDGNHNLTESGCSSGGSGTVTAAAQYDVPYYTQVGTVAQVGGAAISGFQYDSTSGAPQAATQGNLGTLLNITSGQALISGGSGSAVTGKAIQGTDTNLLTSGTISGTSALLCTDANGGATTSSCPSGGGTTTNALTMNNGGAGAASGTTFNGSGAVTLSYNTLGAAPLASPTFTGKVTVAASSTSGAGINIPTGAAPTTPASGDCWTTTTTSTLWNCYLGSTTYSFGALAVANSWSSAQTFAGWTSSANNIISNSPTVSQYALRMNGAVQAGGTGTTNFPYMAFVNGSPTAATDWNTAGTVLGFNPQTLTGSFIRAEVNGGGYVYDLNYNGLMTVGASGGLALKTGGSTSNCWNTNGTTTACGGNAGSDITSQISTATSSYTSTGIALTIAASAKIHLHCSLPSYATTAAGNFAIGFSSAPTGSWFTFSDNNGGTPTHTAISSTITTLVGTIAIGVADNNSILEATIQNAGSSTTMTLYYKVATSGTTYLDAGAYCEPLP